MVTPDMIVLDSSTKVISVNVHDVTTFLQTFLFMARLIFFSANVRPPIGLSQLFRLSVEMCKDPLCSHPKEHYYRIWKEASMVLWKCRQIAGEYLLLLTFQPYMLCCQDKVQNGAWPSIQPSQDRRMTLQQPGWLSQATPLRGPNPQNHANH